MPVTATRSARTRPALGVLPRAVAVVLLAVGPSVARAQEQAAPKPFEAVSASASALRDSLVAMARAQLGRRYVRGGTTPDRGFDCSGLVKYIAQAFHLDVPRTARQQAASGLAVARDTSRLLPGDLLTFGKGKKGVSHIGIYIGNGRFIHASTKAGHVIESPLDRPLYRGVKPWVGARRLLASADSAPASAASAPGTTAATGALQSPRDR